MKKYLLPILLVLIMALIPIQNASADFGSYAGDSDYGGSSSDWGSSSSDWGSSSSDWDFGDFDGSLIILIILIPIAVIAKLMDPDTYSGTEHHTHVSPDPKPTRAASIKPISSLRDKDPAFSEAIITERIANWYVQMQNCWTDRNLEPLRSYLTDDLYARTSRMLEDMRRAGEINRVERIAVLGVELLGWTSDNVNDTLHARLRTRITDYVVDEHTEEVKRGNPNAELFMEYEWTLIRAKGMTTQQQSGTTDISCPNCGAPMNIAQSAQCPYCHTTVKHSEHVWVLSSIKGISQHTVV